MCLHSIFSERSSLRLIYLVTESTQPSIERDFSFISFVDVNAKDSVEDHQKKLDALSLTTNNDDAHNPNMFQINLSNKITKNNGTLYLAVFSVPLTENMEAGKTSFKGF